VRAVRATVFALVCGAIGLYGPSASSMGSELNRLPPARAPCSVLSEHPCHPSFCSVFHRGPCFPQYELPFGQTLGLTIVSTDGANPGDAGGKPAGGDGGSQNHALASIEDMFAALRACWTPPPKDEAHHGMEYTIRFAFKRDGKMIARPRVTYTSHDASATVRGIYREAVDAAIKRCVPLHFSDAMGGAIAGRPIAIRFVDERTIDKDSGK
jgi:hypothetical protein